LIKADKSGSDDHYSRENSGSPHLSSQKGTAVLTWIIGILSMGDNVNIGKNPYRCQIHCGFLYPDWHTSAVTRGHPDPEMFILDSSLPPPYKGACNKFRIFSAEAIMDYFWRHNKNTLPPGHER
jgi:hypothetical protein